MFGLFRSAIHLKLQVCVYWLNYNWTKLCLETCGLAPNEGILDTPSAKSLPSKPEPLDESWRPHDYPSRRRRRVAVFLSGVQREWWTAENCFWVTMIVWTLETTSYYVFCVVFYRYSCRSFFGEGSNKDWLVLIDSCVQASLRLCFHSFMRKNQ